LHFIVVFVEVGMADDCVFAGSSNRARWLGYCSLYCVHPRLDAIVVSPWERMASLIFRNWYTVLRMHCYKLYLTCQLSTSTILPIRHVAITWRKHGWPSCSWRHLASTLSVPVPHCENLTHFVHFIDLNHPRLCCSRILVVKIGNV